MTSIRLPRTALLVPVVALALAGAALGGCESDDTSPLAPATDAGGDHAAASDAPAPTTDAPASDAPATTDAPASSDAHETDAAPSDAPVDSPAGG
jgi:hypothetical protein